MTESRNELSRPRAKATRAGMALLVAAATSLVLSSAAMAGYNIWTGEYTFTRQELQQAVATRFPAQSALCAGAGRPFE